MAIRLNDADIECLLTHLKTNKMLCQNVPISKQIFSTRVFTEVQFTATNNLCDLSSWLLTITYFIIFFSK